MDANLESKCVVKYRNLVLLLFLFSLSTHALGQKKIWLDGAYNKTGKSSALYYGIIEKDAPGFILKVYRFDNRLYSVGSYSKGKKPETANRIGILTYYFPNGDVSSTGHIRGENKVGVWKSYYMHGGLKSDNTWTEFGNTIKSTTYYSNGLTKKEKNCSVDSVCSIKHYYPSGGIWRILKMKDEELVDSSYTYFTNGKLAEVSYYRNGKREGEALFFHENGEISAKELYSEGKIISADFFDDKGNKQDLPIDTVFQMPVLDESVLTRLSKNIEYPNLAKENNIQGRVIIQFLLNTNGKATHFEVVSTELGYGLEEEALRVVSDAVKFSSYPSNHNRKECILFNLPIKFELN